jgi:tRNA (cytidine/uridine-2'-O-)-methyltransferase
MPLHVALLESNTPALVGAIARTCGAVDASLHLVGPLPFERDDQAFRKAGPRDWDALDLWVHPGWRDFRDAMARERCLYFSHDADREATEAPFRANSVLVIGTEGGTLPDRIKDKYPARIYRLPQPARKGKTELAQSVEALLRIATERQGQSANGAVVVERTTPMRYGRGPSRTRR